MPEHYGQKDENRLTPPCHTESPCPSQNVKKPSVQAAAKGQKHTFVENCYIDRAEEDELSDGCETYEDLETLQRYQQYACNINKAETTGKLNCGPFPFRLHAILKEVSDGVEGYDQIMTWLPHGRSFAILKHELFISEIMPKYFKQSKIASFQRQLNLYGFRRITGSIDNGSYYHEYFLRGKPFLTRKMVRPKLSKGPSITRRAPSSLGAEPDFYSMIPVGVSKHSSKNLYRHHEDMNSTSQITSFFRNHLPPPGANSTTTIPSSFAAQNFLTGSCGGGITYHPSSSTTRSTTTPSRSVHPLGKLGQEDSYSCSSPLPHGCTLLNSTGCLDASMDHQLPGGGLHNHSVGTTQKVEITAGGDGDEIGGRRDKNKKVLGVKQSGGTNSSTKEDPPEENEHMNISSPVRLTQAFPSPAEDHAVVSKRTNHPCYSSSPGGEEYLQQRKNNGGVINQQLQLQVSKNSPFGDYSSPIRGERRRVVVNYDSPCYGAAVQNQRMVMRGQNNEESIAASPNFVSPLPKPHLPRDEMHQDLEIDLYLLEIHMNRLKKSSTNGCDGGGGVQRRQQGGQHEPPGDYDGPF
jgi:hypothetical protein